MARRVSPNLGLTLVVLGLAIALLPMFLGLSLVGDTTISEVYRGVNILTGQSSLGGMYYYVQGHTNIDFATIPEARAYIDQLLDDPTKGVFTIEFIVTDAQGAGILSATAHVSCAATGYDETDTGGVSRYIYFNEVPVYNIGGGGVTYNYVVSKAGYSDNAGTFNIAQKDTVKTVSIVLAPGSGGGGGNVFDDLIAAFMESLPTLLYGLAGAFVVIGVLMMRPRTRR